jgi:signal peptidase I
MSKKQSSKPDTKPDGVKENIRVFIFAAVIAILIRSLFFQPFNIPSSSMKPTLLIGDFLFVSKFSYGYSRHSVPFSLLPFSGRTSDTQPERGDVVVFKLPADNRTDFIKRVIGLPGDTLQMINGQLFLNGVGVKRERIDDFVEPQRAGEPIRIRRFRETLPSGRSYEVLDQIDNGPVDTTPMYQVPDGHYFMMGDNRDNSTDSRFGRYVGYVPHENLVGPAQILFFSFDDRTRWYEVWRWPISIRGSRLFDLVR